MKRQIIIALKYLLIMTLLTGLIYPLLMTGIAQIAFHTKANGSLVIIDGKIKGSELIGQKFDSSVYFWSRPSATGYNPIPSGASNFGPTSDTLKKQVIVRRILFVRKNLIADTTDIPKEMIFASASGLDPHISPEAAILQIDRVAAARNLDLTKKQQLQKLVLKMTEKPQFSLFGEPRINVFELNLALDSIK